MYYYISYKSQIHHHFLATRGKELREKGKGAKGKGKGSIVKRERE
jgi:hypothetical protein